MRYDKVTVWKDAAGEWRWTRRARNGKVVAVSGEGYKRRSHAVLMAFSVNEQVQQVRCETADGVEVTVSRPDGPA